MKLSPRELQVIHLMADGMRDKEIAHELGIALDTMRGYRRNIFAKLGVNNRTSAVLSAIAWGFLHLQQFNVEEDEDEEPMPDGVTVAGAVEDDEDDE